jgi:hypothetical protein
MDRGFPIKKFGSSSGTGKAIFEAEPRFGSLPDFGCTNELKPCQKWNRMVPTSGQKGGTMLLKLLFSSIGFHLALTMELIMVFSA